MSFSSHEGQDRFPKPSIGSVILATVIASLLGAINAEIFDVFVDNPSPFATGAFATGLCALEGTALYLFLRSVLGTSQARLA